MAESEANSFSMAGRDGIVSRAWRLDILGNASIAAAAHPKRDISWKNVTGPIRGVRASCNQSSFSDLLSPPELGSICFYSRIWALSR